MSECTCNDGLATADGSTTTTSARCDQCRTDYYRDGGCVRCPAMSGRVFSDNETTCTCNQGYRHPNGSVDTTTEDCVGEFAWYMCVLCGTLRFRICTMSPDVCNGTRLHDLAKLLPQLILLEIRGYVTKLLYTLIHAYAYTKQEITITLMQC